MSKREPIHSLYLVKAICAFMVVGIHSAPGGIFRDFFRPLFDIAVPLFFMISGYFLGLSLELSGSGSSASSRWTVLCRYLKSISYICLIVVGVYVVAGIFIQDAPISWEKVKYNIYHLHRGVPATGLHLWYLFALWGAAGCLLIASIHKYVLQTLLFGSLLLGVLHNFGLTLPPSWSWASSTLFQALPNISIGCLVAQYALADRLGRYQSLLAIFGLCAVFLLYYGVDKSWSSLGISLISVVLFVWALSHKSYGKGSTLELIGKRYSQGIYYWHLPLVYLIVSPEKHIVGWENELRLLITIILSINLAWLVEKTQDLLAIPARFRV